MTGATGSRHLAAVLAVLVAGGTLAAATSVEAGYRGGGHHRGGHYGRGHYGGGYYGGGYRGHGYYRHGHYAPGYYPYGYYGGGYYGHGYHGSGWGFGLGLAVGALTVGVLSEPQPVAVYTPGYSAVGYVQPAVYGSIDVEVRPRSAAVYLDGQAVGTAGDFDGWPAKLHAEPGSHELEFRAPGYKPLRVAVEVYPGQTVQIRSALEPAATGPSWRTIETDTEPISSPEPEPPEAPPAAWRRAPERVGGEAGSLRLTVRPGDASVYIDGQLTEAAAGSSGLHLALAAGSHRIEVVKPGYDVFSGELQIRARQTQELDVRLVAEER